MGRAVIFLLSESALIALGIFIIVYALIISEKIQRTIAALCGGVLMIMTGILTQEKAISAIDFNTLGLLIGMMIIVGITMETGLFKFLAIWAAKRVEADPIKLMAALSILTAVCSGFLDNVTTVLLTVPVTFHICERLRIPAYPFLMAQIMSSNIGGTATLIGDPPNVMIGSAVPELDFMAFITNLGLVCAVILAVVIALFVAIYRKDLRTTVEARKDILAMDEKKEITDSTLLKQCLFVLALVILGFIFHAALGWETATIALGGAALLMLLAIRDNEDVISDKLANVEWTAIFFFIGLFVVIGGLVETGVIKLMAQEAMKATGTDTAKATMLILWLSAIASAFIDNIPFVATMIPLIKDMGTMGMTNLTPLWWALSLGACLGGNGTLIGASANVVVAGLARQHGVKMTFVGYLKFGFPMMILSIAISAVYLYLRYL